MGGVGGALSHSHIRPLCSTQPSYDMIRNLETPRNESLKTNIKLYTSYHPVTGDVHLLDIPVISQEDKLFECRLHPLPELRKHVERPV